jgi:hypothetical protein
MAMRRVDPRGRRGRADWDAAAPDIAAGWLIAVSGNTQSAAAAA